MFKKSDRLTTQEFQAVIDNGKTVRIDTAHLKYLPTETKKFAVAVPKKIVKTSVGRHLVKRRIFAALKVHKEHFPVGHYILFASKELVDANLQTLESIIGSLAERVAS